MRGFLVPLFIGILAAGACSRSRPADALCDELMETDRMFSRISAEAGREAAFLQFMAPEGIVYPMRGEPVRGKEEFSRLARAAGEGSGESRLVWEPVFADVSVSGELGYTLGRYTASVRLPDGTENVRRGHYVTIWKRQADGTWKFVFDGGNQTAPEDPDKEGGE